MKPKRQRRILAEAFTLTAEVFGRLAERGVPEHCWPQRDEVLAAVIPLACRLERARKLERRTRNTHAVAAELLEWQRAQRAARLERIAARFGDVPPSLPAGVRVARSVPFDPAAWRVSLAPVGVAQVREVA